MAATDGSTSNSFQDFIPASGGCYCKKVTYTLHAPPLFVNCCHCRNCQTLTGSAFAINIMVETEHLKISPSTQSSDLTIQDNHNAEGDFAGNSTRCAHCHTLLWATHPFTGSGISYLRAGTLSESEKLAIPTAHFFVRSKHPWVTLPEGAKAWDTFPPPGEEVMSPEAKKRLENATTKSK